jgi:subtilisin family serine protease
MIAAATLAAIAAAPMAVAADAGTTAVVGTGSPQEAQDLAAELRREGLDVRTIPRIGALEVSGDDIDAVRHIVGDDRRVDWIEPNHDRNLFVIGSATVDAETGREYIWAMNAVSVGEGLSYLPPTLPVKVAVVDSGIDVAHADLAGRIGPTYDVLSGGTGVRDFVGHGTFVAGLISAIDGNGLGGHGVAGATTVIPIRITTNGVIKSPDSAAGIVKAVDAGAKVVNLSYGGDQLSAVEKSALAYAAQKDVLIVAAAGNNFLSGNKVQYPAAAVGGLKGGWGQGLSVAATDPFGDHAPFSSANDFVSVAAPGAGAGECGDGVFSTIPANLTTLWDDPNNDRCTRVVTELSSSTGRYGYAEGTSFATPLVAGAAALARDVNTQLTAEQTADVIRRSATRTGSAAWNRYTGAGILDVGAAVALARVYDTADPVPALNVTPVAGGLSVVLSGHDAAGPLSTPAGITSFRLERSTDGKTYAATGGAQASPVTYDETAPPGETRWYRGTVCDAVRNCATALSGPIVATPPTPAPPVAIAALRPAMRAVAAVRVRARGTVRKARGTCRDCIRVTFTATGTGPLRWSVRMTAPKAGVKTGLRTGVVPAGGRVTALIPLSRLPVCGARLTLAVSVTSALGTARSTKALAISGACRRR